jgi:sensor histidine kinase regulating citrate/malate metabolism
MFNSHKWLIHESETKLDHDRFIALINSLGEGFIAVSDKGVIELSNGVALSMLDANVLKGKNLHECLHFVDQAGGQVDLTSKLKGLTSGHLRSSDWELKQHDGTFHKIYVSISPVQAYEGRYKGGFVILLRDLTSEINDARNPNPGIA